MKKAKKKQPAPRPVTDHPTGIPKPFSMRPLFSLVEAGSQPQGGKLFYSYDLQELNERLSNLEAMEKHDPLVFNPESVREQIRLIELLNTPKDGPTLLRWNFEQADAYQSELMYRLAVAGEMDAFKSFEQKTQDYFGRLKQLASDGHEEALQSLAKIAIEATEIVNSQVIQRMELFRPVAAERTHWPFLKSLNKQLNRIKTDEEDDVLKKLHSGAATQQDLAAANRYDPNNPAMAIAQKLLNYTTGMRRLANLIFRENLPEKPQPKEGTPYFLMLAGRLPDPSRDSKAAEQWWKLAKRFLCESYPALDLQSNAPMDDIAPMLLKISAVVDPKKRKGRILYNLERAFMTMLAKPVGTTRISS